MSSLYTKDFQINLIVHLAKDEEFFKSTLSYLRHEDFDLAPCQLVLEALQSYYGQYRALPDFNTLQVHVLRTLQNVDGRTLTLVKPDEYEALSYVMNAIATTTRLNTDYYRNELSQYLKAMRAMQIVRGHMDYLSEGQSVDDFFGKILQVNQEISTHTAEVTIDSMDENPEPILEATDVRRINTGLKPLDNRTSGGLGLGEIGMITACPGVGKTTGLINFMYGAILTGIRCLFFTLELSARRIKHRYQGIAAHIAAGTFKKPVREWSPEELERYQFILNPEYKYFGYADIADMSKRSFSVEDIDTSIQRWLEKNNKKHDTVNNCKLVCVDWLDKLDPAGIRINKNTREDTLLMKLNEKLGELARRYDLGLWTATQGTREADGREILQMRHTAHGYHKNDPLDISLGIGVVNDGTEEAGDEALISQQTEDSENAPVCNRQLMGSIMKNRDNPPGSFRFYQGPTLRFWQSDSEAKNKDREAKEGRYIGTIGYRNQTQVT